MSDTPRCGAFRRDSLFGTIHYCELAHGHSQSHQGASGGWSGIWPRVKGDDASIAISRFEYDVLREALRAARLTLTSGGIAMDTVRQIDRALATAEGKS